MPTKPLSELTPDPENARLHTHRGRQLLRDTLQKVGAGRSIVIDEAGTVIAGNATREAAEAVGIAEVQVVEAEPDTLVAVRRSNLTEDEKRDLALADNRAADMSMWDVERLKALASDGRLSLDDFWTPVEIEALAASANPLSKSVGRGAAARGSVGGEALTFDGATIPLTPAGVEAVHTRLKEWMDQMGSSDGFGFRLVLLMEAALRERDTEHS